MDNATQQNAAQVEEVAAAASSLQEQASHLAQLVSFFKVSQQVNDSQARQEVVIEPSNQHKTVPKMTLPSAVAKTISNSKALVQASSGRKFTAASANGGDWEEF